MNAVTVPNVLLIVQLVDFPGAHWTQEFLWHSFSLQTSSGGGIFAVEAAHDRERACRRKARSLLIYTLIQHSYSARCRNLVASVAEAAHMPVAQASSARARLGTRAEDASSLTTRVSS
jgi:hypothetical protein